jgi:solute carrier family 35 protein
MSFSPLGSACAYAVSSVAIILVNKTTFELGFNSPLILTVLHLAAGLFGLVAFKIDISPIDLASAVRIIPLSLLFAANIYLGTLALSSTDVSMFTALRRLSIVFVVAFEWRILRKIPNAPTIVSISVMSMGAVMAGLSDIGSDAHAYSLVFLNNLCTALYFCLVKLSLSGSDVKLNDISLLYYNSLFSLPLLVMVAFATGQHHVIYSPLWSSGTFVATIALGSALAFAVNLFSFRCTQLNSALTTCVTGQMKNIGTSLFGHILFHRKASSTGSTQV